jgi:hypothetical protein
MHFGRAMSEIPSFALRERLPEKTGKSFALSRTSHLALVGDCLLRLGVEHECPVNIVLIDNELWRTGIAGSRAGD